MNEPTQRLLDRLAGVTRSGDSWIARCPAHDDQRASLHIANGDKGGCLVKCHAGCATVAVLEKLGLRMADLMPERSDRAERREMRFVCDYLYRDADGTLLYRSRRFDLGGGAKTFKQHAHRSNGHDWQHDMKGCDRRVLYRLDRLSKQQPEAVFIAEGEKDVEALEALGLPATTNVGGAGKWRPEYSAQLVTAGVQRVYVIADEDPAGVSHAQAVASSCHAAGITARVVRLPGESRPQGFDISDWINDGGTYEALLELARQAPIWQPSEVPASVPTVTPRPAVKFYSAAEIVEKGGAEANVLVGPGLVVAGAITAIDGRAKVAGKTTFVLEAIVRPLLDGGVGLDGKTLVAAPVVYLSEQNPRTLTPALQRAGLDAYAPDRFRILTWVDSLGVDWADVVRAAGTEAERIGARLLTSEQEHRLELLESCARDVELVSRVFDFAVREGWRACRAREHSLCQLREPTHGLEQRSDYLEQIISFAVGWRRHVRRQDTRPRAHRTGLVWRANRRGPYPGRAWRHIVAKVEHHQGELFPRVGFPT